MGKTAIFAAAAIAVAAVFTARADYERLLVDRIVAESGKSAVCSPYAFLSLVGMLGDAESGSEAHARIAAKIGILSDFASLFREKNARFAALFETNGVGLVTANSLWLRNFHRVRADYLRNAWECYGAAMGPYGSVAAPNAWTAAVTDGLLEGDTVHEFRIDRTALAVCAAAWRSPWERPFAASADGILRDTRNCRIAKSAGFTTVEIPFRGATHFLRIHLPDADRTPADIIPFLFASRRSLEERLVPATVRLQFPKIDVSSEGDAIEFLREAAIPVEGFGDIVGTAIKLRDARWRCRAVIDENGGVAAETPKPETPVTAGEPVAFDCDRPFAFEIVSEDRTTLIFGILDHRR